MSNTMHSYYVHRNSGNAVFVKEEDFFIDQGGLTQSWGKSWIPVEAKSLEHARELGDKLIPERGGA